jgi:hypothetical protein
MMPEKDGLVQLTAKQYQAMYWALLQIACGRRLNGTVVSRQEMTELSRRALIEMGEGEEWSHSRIIKAFRSVNKLSCEDLLVVVNNVGSPEGSASNS